MSQIRHLNLRSVDRPSAATSGFPAPLSASDDHGVARQTREIIRLWNALRTEEQALLERPGSDARARVFAVRRQLQQALARRDRLVAGIRHADPTEV